MVKIHVQEDCGNAPKKLFVKDLIVAMVNKDRAFMDQHTTEDIQWNMVGGASIKGKEPVLTTLQRSRSEAVTELTIHTIVTHGYDGVAEGSLKFRDGTTQAFCDVYRFRSSTNNAPVKAITTYAIALAKK
ncbi:nuclear transport factor 2 family protein [Chitinophaga varians]|uniref:nuclear transport factor 2 family protein n=1 Tax=Chitinophaga varians TaxID=2202339 RepID=UPI00165F9C42|nr:nuclear transport factor 2 family protein [Chitinophaga varians]MBC9909722.1 nuclear transport factor 2 family protein [Chitinophaga varians]